MPHLEGVIWISHQSNFSKPVKSYPVIGPMSYRKLYILFAAMLATAALYNPTSDNTIPIVIIWIVAFFFAFVNRSKTYSSLETARQWLSFTISGGPNDLGREKVLGTGLDKTEDESAQSQNFFVWVYSSYIKPVVEMINTKRKGRQ